MQNKLIKWSEQFESYHIPRWNELPELELYMDQVIEYITSYVSIFSNEKQENMITPSMINNYVKLGLIPPPVKKKYSKVHISNILVITIIKQATIISEIRDAIDIQIKTHGGRGAYNIFCEELEKSIKHIHKTISNKAIVVDQEINLDILAVKSISIALSSKIIATKVLELKCIAHNEGENNE